MASSKILMSLAAMSLMTACGSSNFNQIFTDPEEKESADYLLSQSEYNFDQGHFDEAQSQAQTVWDHNHNSEKAAMLLGYIHLAKAGVDTFTLADNLIQMSDTGNTANPATRLASGNKDAPDVLATLGGIVSVDNDEFLGFTVGGQAQETSVDVFKDYPVYLPKTGTDARGTTGAFMNNVMLAVRYLCPYVSDAVKNADDSRHNCTATTNPTIQNQGRIHYVWAFIHLAEAIAFNNVVLYKNADTETPNLLNRVTALTGLEGDLAFYAEGAVELSTTVDAIFPLDETAQASMLNTIFMDFESTIKALDEIAGLPDKMKSNIESAFTKLKSQRDQISGVDDTLKNSTALKQQFTKKLKDSLGQQITRVNGNDDFAANKTSICDAYTKIAGLQTNDLPACQ